MVRFAYPVYILVKAEDNCAPVTDFFKRINYTAANRAAGLIKTGFFRRQNWIENILPVRSYHVMLFFYRFGDEVLGICYRYLNFFEGRGVHLLGTACHLSVGQSYPINRSVFFVD